ncbi:hypothetical protein PHLGIDRAFT_15538 [Phlebiopsis gigantea 11061_1 CR5-6]|uniref:F-box domain-containing protein n=1 Tax=Phlebiopsis gigantea (strain 11061_1 CR5-6) TaxID=745531 RepID=A0A0C3NGQ0_PHLG1|nr:hypothetical protein PHLGIDRAFT_15538 [Phlebiopsis gigantea 11061_1 CR5-6]
MADRIPPELFENILHHLPGEVNARNPWRSRKRILGTCSLTCRYWAAYIRPFIFAKLALKSREDMSSFLAVMKGSKPTFFEVAISKYVKELYLLQTVPSDPWIPLLLNFTPKTDLPNLTQINVLTSCELSAESDMNTTSTRSIYYQDLPVALPAAHIWRLSRHSITSIHFRTFKDALAVITSFDSARTDCVGITWAQPAALLPESPPASVRTAPRWAGGDKIIRVLGCAAVWPFVWALVTTRRVAGPAACRPLFVEGAQLPTVLRLVRCLADGCTCSRCAVAHAKEGLFYRVGKYRDPVDGASSISLTVDKGEFEVHSLRVWVEDSGMASSIAVAIDIDPIITAFSASREDLAATLDWMSLDEQAFSLGSAMSNFTVDIQASDISAVNRFATTVTNRMGRLTSAKRLSFRYRLARGQAYKAWTFDMVDGGPSTQGAEDPEEVPDWYLKW